MAIFTKHDADNNQDLFADAGQAKVYAVYAVNSDGTVEDLTPEYQYLKSSGLFNVRYFTIGSGWVLGNETDRRAFGQIALAYKQGVTWDAVRKAVAAAFDDIPLTVALEPTHLYLKWMLERDLLDYEYSGPVALNLKGL
jgi:hypothetical protein